MKNRSLLRAGGALVAASLGAATLTACGSGDATDTLTFAAVPAESSASLGDTFENIVALIEQETGREVEFQNASDYAAVIEGQRAGQIDIASFGPFSYVIAKDSGVNIEAVAAPTDDPAEMPAYTSLAYVLQDSEVENLEDLADRTVCFVDAASTSGYLVPMKGLNDVGIDVDEDLTAVLAGGHDASLLSLEADNCEVAFAHNTMLQTLEATGQIEEGALRAVWESEPITEDPIALNVDTLGEELSAQITDLLHGQANKPALVEAGICSSEEDCVLPEETGWGYVPVDDSDFDAIREICAVTNADACQNVN